MIANWVPPWARIVTLTKWSPPKEVRSRIRTALQIIFSGRWEATYMHFSGLVHPTGATVNIGMMYVGANQREPWAGVEAGIYLTRSYNTNCCCKDHTRNASVVGAIATDPDRSDMGDTELHLIQHMIQDRVPPPGHGIVFLGDGVGQASVHCPGCQLCFGGLSGESDGFLHKLTTF